MLRKTSSGIGFIEVMTAVVIISIAALGILMGAVHARGELHALEVKERATEELLNYMEYWKGRIADGVLSSSEWSGDCLLYTSPSPRDATLSRMPSSA